MSKTNENQQQPSQQQTTPQVSYGECHGCEERRILFYGYCADCMADSHFMRQIQPVIQQQPQPQPSHDDRAREIIEQHIENDEDLLYTVRAIIQRAYADAEQAQQEDPDSITTPRVDAADALRELFDEANPLYEDGGVWLTLIDFALDRCDWYAIVDHQRRVMEENRAADQIRQHGEKRSASL